MSLKENLVATARALIREDGPDALSLRDLARRHGVSHQAPYKHFPHRDDLLVALLAQEFHDFGAFLDDRPLTGEPNQDLRSLGLKYLDYADKNPEAYQLMFERPWPTSVDSSLKKSARLAYDRLKNLIPGDPGSALFVWVVVHGLAGILSSPVFEGLELGSREDVINNVLGHVDFGLLGTPSPNR